MFAAGEWALKRLLKFFLKRALRNIIKTRIDLEQLNVGLGEGRLELREVLLNTEYLNEHLVALPWEVTAAFVGSVTAVIPITALHSESCVVMADEVYLTLRPRGQSEQLKAAQEGPSVNSPSAPSADVDLQADSAISDGVRYIAGGLETLLQRLKVLASNVVIRLDVPVKPHVKKESSSGDHVVIVGVESVEYSGSNQQAGVSELGTGSHEGSHPQPGDTDGGVAVTKKVAFSGLTLEVEPYQGGGHPLQGASAASPPRACSLLGAGGCGGSMSIDLSWGPSRLSTPRIALRIQLETLHIHLRPQHIVGVAAVLLAASSAVAAGRRTARAEAARCALQPPSAPIGEHLVPGSRSFIEGLMLPDCEGLVVEALQGGGAGSQDSMTGQEEVDEFYDARSLLGSLQSSSASWCTSAHESWPPTGHAGQWVEDRPRESPTAGSSPFHQAHDLAASIRQVQEPMEWDVHASLPAITLAVLYPTEEADSGEYPAAATHAVCPSRLSVEMEGISLVGSGGCGGVHYALTAHRLEASEHLQQREAAREVRNCWRTMVAAEEFARVPQVLTPPPATPWAGTPTAGTFPVAGASFAAHQGSGFRATLGKLSDLQASAYEGSLRGRPGRGGHPPGVCVMPVLLCGRAGGREGSGRGGSCPRASLLVHVGMGGSRDNSQDGAKPRQGVDVTVASLPLTLWVSAPFLERLAGVIQPVHEGLGKLPEEGDSEGGEQATGACAPPAQPGCLEPKVAVSAAIDDILAGMQDTRCRAEEGPGLCSSACTIRVFLPTCTMVAPIVESAVPPATLSHPYSYVGLVLSMHTSAADVVVRGFTQMGGHPQLHECDVLVSQLRELPAMVPSLAVELPTDTGTTSMASSGFEPVTAVERGSSSLQCCLAAGRAELVLVGSTPVDGDCSVMGSYLVAHPVCDMASQEYPGAKGLGIHIQWSNRRTPCPSLLDDAWDRLGRSMPAAEPSEEQGRWDRDGLDVSVFKQQCLRTSPLHARMSIPALSVSLSPPALAALANVVDGMMQLAPQPEPSGTGSNSPGSSSSRGDAGRSTSATQAAMEVECGIDCRLLDTLDQSVASNELFRIQVHSAQILSVGNLSGVSGGGAQLLWCKGLDVWSTDTTAGTRNTLLHCPVDEGAAGACLGGLQVVSVSRPLSAGTGSGYSVREHPRSGRLYIATESRIIASVRGCTLGAPSGDIKLSWAPQLLQYFKLRGEADSEPIRSASPASQNYPQEVAAALEWAVQAEDIAVRLEPCSAEACGMDRQVGSSPDHPVAAVVLIGSVECWGKASSAAASLEGSPQAKPAALPVHLRCISVELAPLGQRVGHWSPCTPQHVFGAKLRAAGYKCAATEGEIVVKLSQGPAGTVCEVKNHMLHLFLSQQTCLLVRQLWRQIQDAGKHSGHAERSDSVPGTLAGQTQDAMLCGSALESGSTGGNRQHLQLVHEAAANACSRLNSIKTGSSSNSGAAGERLAPATEDGWEVHHAEAAGGSASAAACQVLQGVKDNVYSSARADASRRLESVYIDGGWYEALDSEPWSPAGSPPVLLNSFSGGAAARGGSKESSEEACEGRGVWFERHPVQKLPSKWLAGPTGLSQARHQAESIPTNVFVEDYIKEGQGIQPTLRWNYPAGQKCVIGELPPEIPSPLLQTLLRDINITANLCDEVLSGKASTSRQLRLQVHRLCMQVDEFSQLSPYAKRIAVSIHSLKLLEREGEHCTRRNSSAGESAHGVASKFTFHNTDMGQQHGVPNKLVIPTPGNAGWKEILMYDIMHGASRDPEDCMVTVVVEVVRPDVEQAPMELEQRMKIALLPFKLRLEQDTVIFLQKFFAPFFDTLEEPAVIVEHCDAEPGNKECFSNVGELTPSSSSTMGFVQRCEVQPFAITIDYKPKKINLPALMRGDVIEVLNLFPWGGVTLDMRRVRLFGLHDTSTLSTALVSAWLEDIIQHQIHKFLVGIAPIRSLCKVTSVIMQLITIPVEQLFLESTGHFNRCKYRRLSDTSFSRQLKRGLLAMAKAIANEAVRLGGSLSSKATDELL